MVEKVGQIILDERNRRMEYITFDKYIALIFKEKRILLKKEEDGQIRPIKGTSRKDVYEALYEIQQALREDHLIDY